MTNFAGSLALGLSLSLMTVGGPAGADTEQPQAIAARLFEEAMRDYDDGNLVAAIAKLRAAHRTAPRPTVIYNLAQILETAGRRAEAHRAFEQYLSMQAADVDHPRREAVQRKLEDLEKELALVEVITNARDATIRIDNDVSSARLWVDPGEHAIEVRAVGYRTENVKIRAERGRSHQVVVRMAQEVLAPPAARPTTRDMPRAATLSPPSGAHQSKVLAPALAIAGGALAGSALVLHLVNSSARSDWANRSAHLDAIPADLRNDGYWKSRADNAALSRRIRFVDGVNLGLLVGAAVVVAGGITCWITAPKLGPKGSGSLFVSGTF